MSRIRNRSAARDRPTTSTYDSPQQRWRHSSSQSNDEDSAYYRDDSTLPTTTPQGPFKNFLAILQGLWDVSSVFVRVVRWVINKTGYWLGVLVLPGVFGPMLAVKKTYGQTKRTYYATRYAQEQGYIEGLWPTVSHGLKKTFVVLVGLITAGHVDLTEPVFGKQPTRSVRSTQRRSRGQTKANGRTFSTTSATYSTAPTAPPPSDSEEDYDQQTTETSSVGSLVFAPVRLSWDLVKMLMEIGFLGIYAVFGWTFGRFNVDEQGVMTRKRRGRGSAVSSPRYQRGSNGRQENGPMFSGWSGEPTNDQQ